MPLPDAPDYSKRIYELLKETDLENLSYAQFQGVAEKLFIEPENEDEMRRLVLIQLARMAVRGDWNGFLTGGGGSGGAPTDAEYVVMALNGTLTNERLLAAGTGISLADGGPGSTATIANTGVTSNVAGTGISVSGATGAVTIANTGVTSLGAGDGITLSGSTGSVTVSSPIIGDLVAAQYVTLATDTQLQNERVLTAGSGITLTDGGAGSTITIAASGGGGGSSVYNPVLPATTFGTNGTMFVISKMPPWGNIGTGTSSTTASDSPQYRPWVSPKTGDISVIKFNVNSTANEPNYKIGIYSDSDGFPDTLLGSGTAAITISGGTGVIDITPTTTISTVAGVQYWIAWVRTDVSGAGNFTAESNTNLFWLAPISKNTSNLSGVNQQVTLIESSSNNNLPTTVNSANTEGTFNNPPRWGCIWS